MWSEALDALDPASARGARAGSRLPSALFHRAQLPRTLEIEVLPGVSSGGAPSRSARRRVCAGRPRGVPEQRAHGRRARAGRRRARSHRLLAARPDGLPPATVLAACALGGADRVFAIGGAGAIAALAFGTASVPRVDKIVGPGNAYVTEAKRQLTGVLRIDCPAGPSEILIIADDSADADAHRGRADGAGRARSRCGSGPGRHGRLR